MSNAGIIDPNDEVIRSRVHKQLGLPEPEPRPEMPMLGEGVPNEEIPIDEEGQPQPMEEPITNDDDEPMGIDNAAKTGTRRGV